MKTKDRQPNNPKRIFVIKYYIKQHLEKCMDSYNPGYSLWYCGITNDPNERKKEHKYPDFFKYWDAFTMTDAHKIEIEISQLGMTNNQKGGVHKGSKYIYVFKM